MADILSPTLLGFTLSDVVDASIGQRLSIGVNAKDGVPITAMWFVVDRLLLTDQSGDETPANTYFYMPYSDQAWTSGERSWSIGIDAINEPGTYRISSVEIGRAHV